MCKSLQDLAIHCLFWLIPTLIDDRFPLWGGTWDIWSQYIRIYFPNLLKDMEIYSSSFLNRKSDPCKTNELGLTSGRHFYSFLKKFFIGHSILYWANLLSWQVGSLTLYNKHHAPQCLNEKDIYNLRLQVKQHLNFSRVHSSGLINAGILFSRKTTQVAINERLTWPYPRCQVIYIKSTRWHIKKTRILRNVFRISWWL